MNNIDRLIRLRYALDIKDTDVVEIFKLGGILITKEEVKELFARKKEYCEDDDNDCEGIDKDNFNSNSFDSFLNGLIIFKRGKQDSSKEEVERPEVLLKDNEGMNNIMLKKVKIALSLTSDDIIDILAEVGISLTKGELGAIFRKEGHKNYRECGDKYARNFLKGLAMRYRRA